MKYSRQKTRSMEYRRDKSSCEIRILTKTKTKLNFSRSSKRSRSKGLVGVIVLVLRIALEVVKELVGSGKHRKITILTGAF